MICEPDKFASAESEKILQPYKAMVLRHPKDPTAFMKLGDALCV